MLALYRLVVVGCLLRLLWPVRRPRAAYLQGILPTGQLACRHI